MPIEYLPNTDIPIKCFKCYRQLVCDEQVPNPFPTPVKDREEWYAYSYTCKTCGYSGKFQYRVRGGLEIEEVEHP